MPVSSIDDAGEPKKAEATAQTTIPFDDRWEDGTDVRAESNRVESKEGWSSIPEPRP